jgi:hypothetical protein
MEKLNERQQSLKIDAIPGQHINDFAHQLLDIANKNEEKKVTGVFNGIEIDIIKDIDKNLSADDLVEYYHKESERIADEYRNSPEGIREAQENEKQRDHMQKTTNQLIKNLDNLNFLDYEAVLDWICDFQRASDYIGVFFDRSQVISTFEDHGFFIGVNTENDFNGDDAENFAKYLVGQALDGINTIGTPDPLVHQITNKWKESFGKNKKV